ncbi:MAG: hypothetical protein U1C55_04490, partial [Smithellaceae bacterium]|nr:hypothetical protein [Smithellaceae bacterium]
GKSASSGALKKVRMRILSGDGPWEKTLISIKGHYSTDIPLKETGEYQAILAIETEKNGNVEFRVNLKNE